MCQSAQSYDAECVIHNIYSITSDGRRYQYQSENFKAIIIIILIKIYSDGNE